jgi:uncharacterized protein (TIGR02145 family)
MKYRSKVVWCLCLLLAGLGIVAVVPHIAHAATRCEACKGTGKDICEFCGGRGCAQCNWKGGRICRANDIFEPGTLFNPISPCDCKYCGGTGKIYTAAEKEAMRKAEEELREKLKSQFESAKKAGEEARRTISTFVDNRDGKTYKKIAIGTQTWMGENLNYNSAKSQCYGGKEENCAKYGRLYNFSTAMGACPAGWHLPTSSEWGTLVNYIGRHQAGIMLKSASGWEKEKYNGTDDFGFSALPGGKGIWSTAPGSFYAGGRGGGSDGYWWGWNTNKKDGNIEAYEIKISWLNSDALSFDNVSYAGRDKSELCSIRCVEGVDEVQERIKEVQRNEDERARQQQEKLEAERRAELARQEEARARQAEIQLAQRAQGYIDLGIECHTKGKFDDAIKNYNAALLISPNADVQEYLEMAKKKKKLKLKK